MDKSKKMKAIAAALASKKMPDDADGNALKNRSNPFVSLTDTKANLKKYGKAPDAPFKMGGKNKAQVNRMAQVKKKGK